MKRSAIERKTELKRTDSLKRNAALNRAAAPPEPEKPIKPRKRAPRTRKQQVKVPAYWTSGVFATHGRKCFVTGKPATEAHHIIKAQVLRRELNARTTVKQLEQILGDPRNGLPVSDQPHDDHHAVTIGDRRITRDHLHDDVFEFAADLDRDHGTRLVAWLDRFYPATR